MNPIVAACFLGQPFPTSTPAPNSPWHFTRLTKGEHLYHAGDDFRGLFQVMRGSFKTLSSTCSGMEQVLDFHILGDFMGMDAISVGEYPSTAIALEESEACSISYAALSALCAIHTDVQNNLDIAMSRQIRRKTKIITLLAHTSAAERVVMFLLDLLNRTATADRETDVLALPMKHCDIASFLGMSAETLSRQFVKLQRLGVVRPHVDGVQICSAALECFKGSVDDGGFSLAEATRKEKGPGIRGMSSLHPTFASCS